MLNLKTIQEMDETRRVKNPLFNDNRLKLGTFGTNMSGACTATSAEGNLVLTWPNTRAVAKITDELGFEGIVPIGRWKGLGGDTDFNRDTYEVFTWAAGLAEATSHTAIFSTSHIQTVHPVTAAKQVVTIDHIADGRSALNVLVGWRESEFHMFGDNFLPHDEGYKFAEEWLEIVLRLWTSEEPFDFEGKYFNLKGAISDPKPVQRPYPAIMNAGMSSTGARFAAKYADIAFAGIGLGDEDFQTVRANVDERRRIAWEEFGREIQIWSACAICTRPTEKEAEEFFNYYAVEKADWAAVENQFGEMAAGGLTGRPDNPYKPVGRLSPGWGGYPIVGSPEQAVEELSRICDAGIDGVVLSWVNWEEEMHYWGEAVMPLLEQAGLRRPFDPVQAVSGDDARMHTRSSD